jgi:hypothetical protein
MTTEERAAKEQQMTAAKNKCFDATTTLVLHVYDKHIMPNGQEVPLTKQRVKSHVNQYATQQAQLYSVTAMAGCSCGIGYADQHLSTVCQQPVAGLEPCCFTCSTVECNAACRMADLHCA